MLLNTQESTDNPIPYAVVKLEESARAIRQAIGELPTLRNRLEKFKDDKTKAREIYGDLQNQHRKLISALNTATLSLLEAEQDDMADYTVKLAQSISAFNLLTPSYEKLCAVLGAYITKLPIYSTDDTANDEAKTTNNRIIGRLMNNIRMGYYPTCPDNLAYIARGIEFPASVRVNLLDPCCGCGLALQTLASENDCTTYGIELDSYRAEEALTRLNRVGFGSFFHSRLSNEAFHAMLLNPPYLWTISEGGNNTRSEKRFLVDSINNLMIGGLLIYIIPYYRLTADICRVLCDNFADLTVWKFERAEFKRFKQVAVMGVRQKRRDGSDMVTALSSLVLEPDKIPELTELPTGCYQLPAIVKDVALFKGAQFNESELAEQLSRSNSLTKLFTKSKLDGGTKRPLLPLSIGQIGLVGGSGLINGLVECSTPHIIKGRIIKEKRTHTDENTNNRGDLVSTTLTETVSNKLIFNLLTPSGFVSLTDYGDSGTIVDVNNDPGDDVSSRLGHSVSSGSDGSTHISGSGYLPLGRVVVTANARNILTDTDINTALARHHSGDWGEVSEADQRANNNAIKDGDRLLSAYISADGDKFWVITEADRSYTTVLMPADY